MALRVGLTGGIGSGKTTVAKMFELLNIPVYYADAEAKRLYENDPELNAAVKKHFGNDVFTSQGLNHSKLASIVFNNPRKLELLNQLVHPVTIRNANAWMQKQTTPYAIKEAALLFESNAASSLDYIVGVSAPANLRIKRAMERDNLMPIACKILKKECKELRQHLIGLHKLLPLHNHGTTFIF